ncbi:16S rRNA (guanine(527)-N(7))-methyltransferase RsmG [uncultured Eubacterium sp.]|uniref:16S rRNA (guanine(527)-N(7))-methyltransferase RsmG n=1 Tax=uncultured Eubacterium sp. TaxID=165185 RepID=UPI0025F1D72F|nr:16S rRNA (guanine(527)-N(7))-methyltransferase RsmG [uncultured Eubacterium sp.]
MIDKNRLCSLAKENGIILDDTALDRFDKYAELLVEWNGKMNLTAITEPEEIEVKHFLDCLMLPKYFNLDYIQTVIDVGVGAGFPSVPLLIYKPDLCLTMMDAINKRLTFLDTAVHALGLEAQLIHERAEAAGQDENYREKFDLATARAVAPMNVLAEYCLPFVKVGGYFVALKGSNDDTEEAKNAIATLGGEVVDNISYKLNGTEPRSIVVIKKISQTPTQFPRKSKKISTKPL